MRQLKAPRRTRDKADSQEEAADMVRSLYKKEIAQGGVDRVQILSPYTHPKRDRKSVLFTATLDRVRASGYMTEIEPILDYCLPNPLEPEAPDRDQYLTDYRFNIIPSLQFGGEGIYIDLLLEGSFDATERTRLHLGTIKTLRQDQKACELMGKLCGLLMFHGSAHVNENIHRYTPKRELEQEYERMLKKQKNKEGESTI